MFLNIALQAQPALADLQQPTIRSMEKSTPCCATHSWLRLLSPQPSKAKEVANRIRLRKLDKIDKTRNTTRLLAGSLKLCALSEHECPVRRCSSPGRCMVPDGTAMGEGSWARDMPAVIRMASHSGPIVA